jgi:diguanylate cyclase (GGDEF)-like protein
MILDTRTLFFLTFLNTLIMGIGLLLAARSFEGSVRRSMTVWGRACLIVILGWMLIGLRDFISPFFSIVVASTLLHYGTAEYYQSLRNFDGQSSYRRYTNILVLAGLVLIAIFLYVHENLIIRIIINSMILMFLFALLAWKLHRHSQETTSIMRHLVGLGFGVMFLIYLLRTIFVLVSPNSLTSMMANTPLQTFVFGGTSLGFSVITFGYLLLCNNHFSNQLKVLAATDALTGLYNRRAFTDLSQQEIKRAVRSGEMPAIFLIDVDDFKAINDRYGHGIGDEALTTISRHLRQILRSHDIVGRFGGDEFIVLLPATNTQKAEKIAARLAQTIRNTPLLVNKNEVHLSISVGLAVAEKERLNFNDLFHQADQSLYEAKRCRLN